MPMLTGRQLLTDSTAELKRVDLPGTVPASDSAAAAASRPLPEPFASSRQALHSNSPTDTDSHVSGEFGSGGDPDTSASPSPTATATPASIDSFSNKESGGDFVVAVAKIFKHYFAFLDAAKRNLYLEAMQKQIINPAQRAFWRVYPFPGFNPANKEIYGIPDLPTERAHAAAAKRRGQKQKVYSKEVIDVREANMQYRQAGINIDKTNNSLHIGQFFASFFGVLRFYPIDSIEAAKEPVTAWGFFKKLCWWPSDNEQAKMSDFAKIMRMNVVLNFVYATWNMIRIVGSTLLNTLKLFTEYLPSVGEQYSFYAMCLLEDKLSGNTTDGYDHPIQKFFAYAAVVLLFAATYLLFKPWRIVGRTITSPMASMRAAWSVGIGISDYFANDFGWYFGRAIGAGLAILSGIITVGFYTVLFPLGIKALITAGPTWLANIGNALLNVMTAFSNSPAGKFVSGLVNDITKPILEYFLYVPEQIMAGSAVSFSAQAISLAANTAPVVAAGGVAATALGASVAYSLAYHFAVERPVKQRIFAIAAESQKDNDENYHIEADVPVAGAAGVAGSQQPSSSQRLGESAGDYTETNDKPPIGADDTLAPSGPLKPAGGSNTTNGHDTRHHRSSTLGGDVMTAALDYDDPDDPDLVAALEASRALHRASTVDESDEPEIRAAKPASLGQRSAT